MKGFNLRDFIERIDQAHEIRVGRLLLSLMKDFNGRETFECSLAPHAFNMQPPQLMATVERITKKLHLDHSASVTFDTEKKVMIAINASDLKTPPVQSTIASMLTKIHQQADQLGI